MTSHTRRFLIITLSVIIFTVSVATFWSFLKSYRLQSALEVIPSHKLASIKGWKFHRSNGSATVYDGSIESFSLERVKLGPFGIGPLHVARVQKVIIDFYLEGLLPNAAPQESPSKTASARLEKSLATGFTAEAEEPPSARSSAELQKPPSKRASLVPARNPSKPSHGEAQNHPSTNDTFRIDMLKGPLADIQRGLFHRRGRARIIEIEGISLNLWAAGKRVFRISSDHAKIDHQTGDIVFTGHASLDAAENGNIISYRITWVRKTSLFRISDPFILTKADQTTQGKELETDYQLKTITYHIKG